MAQTIRMGIGGEKAFHRTNLRQRSHSISEDDETFAFSNSSVKRAILTIDKHLQDWYPTLLEMAGLSPLPHQHVDGVSFADAVKGKSLNERSLFWHFPHYSNHGQQSPGGAIRSGHYKLIEYFENGTTQLFNLQNDPGEQTDLVNQEPELVSALLAELRAWREDADAAMPIGR